LELQGQVLLAPEVRHKEVRAFVRLSRVSEPFSVQTWSDAQGRFKFADLPPGTYTLTASHPKAAEGQKTVEVTPSFASAHGIVTTTITLARPGTSRAGAAQGTIGARELSIPEAARREFREANERLEKQDLKGTIRHLEKAVALAPQFSEALNQLGTIYYQTRDYARAEGYFRQALAQDPEAFAPLVNLGGALVSLRRYEEAVQINLRAVAAQPQDALANSQLGVAYMLLGKNKEARPYLERAKALDPGHFTLPQLPLAEIYLREGLKESALRELEDFLAHHPDSPLADNVREQISRLRSQK
jgi:tetratricopeptide (TPR) repeat protein